MSTGMKDTVRPEKVSEANQYSFSQTDQGEARRRNGAADLRGIADDVGTSWIEKLLSQFRKDLSRHNKKVKFIVFSQEKPGFQLLNWRVL